jgi:multidrug efflux pump
MTISRLFIFRPVAACLLMSIFLISGIIAYFHLPVSSLPNIDYPTIQIQTFLPGASPDVMTATVTTPLERQLGQMPGLSQMESTSSPGVSIITLQFNLNTKIDNAEQEVQAAINAASTLLPATLPSPPTYAKVNPSDAPIITLAVNSSALDLTDVEEIAQKRIAQKLSQLSGVGLVSVSGGHRRAVRIKFDPQALAAHNVSIEELRLAISSANVNIPKGSFDGPSITTTINSNDQITKLADFRNLIIVYRSGRPIYLSDVGTAEYGPENLNLAAWANKKPAIIIEIRRQPGSNAVEVSDSIKSILSTLSSSLPASISIQIINDRTTSIRDSITSLKYELLAAVFLVIFVIYIFFRDLSVTLIAGISVPLSTIGTFAVMYFMGYGIDNFSLMALTISTGFVVDDAIVMIENIIRYKERGLEPLKSAINGSDEIGFTVIVLTISLIAAFIPLLFMGDLVGRLFHEFSITIVVSILISAVVSLVLVPMLCARLQLPNFKNAHDPNIQIDSKFYKHVKLLYANMLCYTLSHRKPALLITIGLFFITIIFYVLIPKGFFPLQDTGVIQAVTEGPQGVSFESMVKLQHRIADEILSDPDVKNITSFVGVDGINKSRNNGRFMIVLKPAERRQSDVFTIQTRLSKKIGGIGAKIYMQPVQDINIDVGESRGQYNFILQGMDLSETNIWASRLINKLRQVPDIVNVSNNLQQDGLAVELVVDRSTASRYGIKPADIDNVLYDTFGQRIISTIYTQASQYRVIMEANQSWVGAKEALTRLYLPSLTSQTNAQVPLSEIVHIEYRHTPLSISHLGQFPAVTFYFDVAPRNSLSEAVKSIETAEKELDLPQSYITTFQGAAGLYKNAAIGEIYLIIAAIVSMYIIMGILYESFIHPVTILSTLPSAGLGALVTLYAFGKNLDIIGFIGIILLIGIVKKNAIMIVDFTIKAQRSGKLNAVDAVTQSCILRLRPILMTTIAAICAAAPMMLGFGVGSELRQPLGFAIVGGLILSQIMTLFTTPIMYIYLDEVASGNNGISRLISSVTNVKLK